MHAFRHKLLREIVRSILASRYMLLAHRFVHQRLVSRLGKITDETPLPHAFVQRMLKLAISTCPLLTLLHMQEG